MGQVIWGGQSGCLLPLLIILNLVFGRAIFNSTYLWLGIEAALVLIFFIKIHVFMQKIREQVGPEARGLSSFWQNHDRSNRPHSRVVDVEGKVVEEKQKLK